MVPRRSDAWFLSEDFCPHSSSAPCGGTIAIVRLPPAIVYPIRFATPRGKVWRGATNRQVGGRVKNPPLRLVRSPSIGTNPRKPIVGATIGRPPILQRKIGSPQGYTLLFPFGKSGNCSNFRRTSNARPYRNAAIIFHCPFSILHCQPCSDVLQ